MWKIIPIRSVACKVRRSSAVGLEGGWGRKGVKVEFEGCACCLLLVPGRPRRISDDVGESEYLVEGRGLLNGSSRAESPTKAARRIPPSLKIHVRRPCVHIAYSKVRLCSTSQTRHEKEAVGRKKSTRPRLHHTGHGRRSPVLLFFRDWGNEHFKLRHCWNLQTSPTAPSIQSTSRVLVLHGVNQ